MHRTKLLRWSVPLLLAALSAALDTTGCLHDNPGHCAPGDPWYQPDHVDQLGDPDPCCNSINPCCPNPMWGRMVTDSHGIWGNDQCCFSIPCPGWDPWKEPYAGPEPSEPDAGADADKSTSPTVVDAGADADMEAGAGGGP